jgi:hypothetical protein
VGLFSKLFRLKSKIVPAVVDGALRGLSGVEGVQAEWARRRVTALLAVGDGRIDGLNMLAKDILAQPELHSLILVHHDAPPALEEQWRRWVDSGERLVVLHSHQPEMGAQLQEAQKLAAGAWVVAISPYAALPMDALEKLLDAAKTCEEGQLAALRIHESWHEALAGFRRGLWRYSARLLLPNLPAEQTKALPPLLAVIWPKNTGLDLDAAMAGVPHGAGLNALAWQCALAGKSVKLVHEHAGVAMPQQGLRQWWGWALSHVKASAPLAHRQFLRLAMRITVKLEGA